MSVTGGKGSGGFHFGNVAGSVSLNAGGDIVGGNKTTTTTTKGFDDEGQKEQFQTQIDQLREALRAVKAEITANAKLGADQKDAMEAEITQHLVALKEVKDQAAVAPAGMDAPEAVLTKVGGALESAGGMMDRLKSLADKSEDVVETVTNFAVKYGPLLLSARHLIGLP